MNKHIALITFLFGGLACYAAKSVHIGIGPFMADHTDFPIVLYLNDYPEFSPNDLNNLAVFDAGKEIVSQLDDLNGDGIPEQLAFMINIAAGEKRTLTIKPTKHHKEFEAEVFAEMYIKSKTPQNGYTYHEAEGKQFYIAPVAEQTFRPEEDSYHSMHHHGVAFESALMAYRIYFDKKQTIDVYAKKTPQLELNACKWYPNDQQLAEGFGDDILRVSGYIGVGACKPYDGEKMIHFDDVEYRTERIVSQGPLRTICEIEDKGWRLNNGHRINVITRYTLYARHRDVLVEVFFSEPVDGMCTGVQKIGTPNYFQAIPARIANRTNTTEAAICPTGGIVASWGTAWPVNDTIKYAKETCGLAVYVPEIDFQQVTTDKNNNLILLQPGNYIRYWFTCVSLKENNPPAKNDEEFFEYVQQWTKSIEE